MALVINANTCYVYRHVRLDKNIPFYVGIGSDNQYSKEAVKLRTQKLKGKKRSKEVMLPCIIAKCKNIIDLSSGIIFDSISEAAASKKINRTTLNAMLRGQNKNTTSLIYI